jgi:hypothetical protein
MRPADHGTEHGEALGGDLETVLAQELGGIDVQAPMFALILDWIKNQSSKVFG